MVGKSGIGSLKEVGPALKHVEALVQFLEHPEKLREIRKTIEDFDKASKRAGVAKDLEKARAEAETVRQEAERLKAESIEDVKRAEHQAKALLDDIRKRESDQVKRLAEQTAELDATDAALQDRKADLDKWEADLRDKAEELAAKQEALHKDEIRLKDWAQRMKAASSA